MYTYTLICHKYLCLYNISDTASHHLYVTRDRHGQFGRCKMIACVITAELETVYGTGVGLELISDRKLHCYPPRLR